MASPVFECPKLESSVPDDNLPDQCVFNILCIGEKGIGKSTIMDSLFNTNFELIARQNSFISMNIKAHTYKLEMGRLKLTIIDTPNYSYERNNKETIKDIIEYMNAQFEAFLQQEQKHSLIGYHDNRIHVCLHFVPATGHGIRSRDIICMQSLNSKVNIIPIIAKADGLMKNELQQFRSAFWSDLRSNKLHIYHYPTNDEKTSKTNADINHCIPFAVVGSSELFEVGNRKIRGREYPWGILDVENESHCDLIKLRAMLERKNMEDLKEKTHNLYYALYREERLKQMRVTDDNKNKSAEYTDSRQKKHDK